MTKGPNYKENIQTMRDDKIEMMKRNKDLMQRRLMQTIEVASKALYSLYDGVAPTKIDMREITGLVKDAAEQRDRYQQREEEVADLDRLTR